MNYTNDDLINMFFEMYPEYKPAIDKNLAENGSEKDKLLLLLDDIKSTFSENNENMIFWWISMLVTKRILVFGDIDNPHDSFNHIKNLYSRIDNPKKYDWQKDNINESNAIYSIAGATRNLTFVLKSKFLNNIVSETGFDVNYGCCYDCGTPLKMNIKGNVITVSSIHGEACTSQRFHKVKVKFPSGKVVAAGGLPGMYDRPDGVYLNDGLSAEVKFNDHYAKKNIAHLFVGNTSPSIYVKGDKIIGGENNEQEDTSGKVGKICTDLWWTTMMDHDEYIKMLKKLGRTKEEIKEIFDFWTFNIFDVEPGTYEFTSRYSSFDEDEFDGVYFEAVKVLD